MIQNTIHKYLWKIKHQHSLHVVIYKYAFKKKTHSEILCVPRSKYPILVSLVGLIYVFMYMYIYFLKTRFIQLHQHASSFNKKFVSSFTIFILKNILICTIYSNRRIIIKTTKNLVLTLQMDYFFIIPTTSGL